MGSTGPSFPSSQAFAFASILRDVETEIQSSIDAIADIYAKSHLSLANEHAAHLPPQAEIAHGQSSQLASMHSSRWRGFIPTTGGLERVLTTVTEASSSKASSRSGTGIAKGKEGRSSLQMTFGSLDQIVITMQLSPTHVSPSWKQSVDQWMISTTGRAKPTTGATSLPNKSITTSKVSVYSSSKSPVATNNTAAIRLKALLHKTHAPG